MVAVDPTLADPRQGGSSSVFSRGLLLDGRYRLERPLGEGGMGTLWVAYQIALQREVAIKALRVTGAQLQARLRQEALALAAVRHPSIVQVFDLGEAPWGAPYIVMEYVRGESLAARLERERALPARDAVALVLPLLDGLVAAHAAGVVHRDLKPENVLLALSPEGVQPKLVDFGIAQLESADHRLTEVGVFVGTPAFMAPEQIEGRVTDERTDVWGVGALLYSMIAGQPAFTASDLLPLLRKVLEAPPPYPRQAAGLDGRLWSILMNTMRKSPQERISSARALRDELAWWLQGQPGRGDPLSEPPSARRASDPPATRGAWPSEAPPASGERPAEGQATWNATTSSPPVDNVKTIDALIQAKLEGA
jgi:serine/threonine protein kinase